jgi:hypothetical protein
MKRTTVVAASLAPWLTGWGAALMLLAIGCRILGADHIPGINGDEGFTSVSARDWLANAPTASPWFTTSHRPIPFYTAPLLLLEWVGWVSPWALRLPGLVGGLLLVGVGAWMVRRLFDAPEVAAGVALLIACMPAHIAYSRVGFDCSQVSLASLCPLYFLLRGAWGWATLCGLLALLVHPMLLMLTPIALLALVFDALPNSGWSRRTQRIGTAGLLLLCVVGAVVAKRYYLGHGQDPTRLNVALYTWKQAAAYLWTLVDMFSGVSTYTYFAGLPGPSALAGLRGLGIGLLGGLGLSGWAMRAATQLPMRRRLLPLGCILSLAAYFVVNPQQDVGTERYMLPYTVPLLLSLGIGAQAWRRARPRRAGVLVAGACMLCSLWLGSFATCYFQAVEHPSSSTGGQVHRTYRTGPVDPKAAALHWVLADAAARGEAAPQIVADGWWTYWVLRYLIPRSSPAGLWYLPVDAGEMPAAAAVPTVEQLAQLGRRGAYAVGFADGLFVQLTQRVAALRVCELHPIPSYAAAPVIAVWRLCPID